MALLESELDKLAQTIKELEKQREILGSNIKKVKENMLFPSKDPDILENKFIFKVKPSNLSDCRIAGVDGGVVCSQYHGVSLVVGRALSVIFTYKNGQLLETSYYPEPIPSAVPLVYPEPISSRDFAIRTSIERQFLEIEIAAKTVEKFELCLLLLDGSIMPHGMDKPSKDSPLVESYKKLLHAYKTLYENCKKHDTLLAGVVEDSAGLRLTNLLESKIVPGIIKSNEFEEDIMLALRQTQEILKKTNDSNIMYHILDVGERSCIFSYSKDPEKHVILQDLKPWNQQINSCYLKSVKFDRPIRIDFLGKTTEIANEVTSYVLALSQHNETYGCPSILIEADARAKLSAYDLDTVYRRLRDKVGDLPSLFKLRRELRPF